MLDARHVERRPPAALIVLRELKVVALAVHACEVENYMSRISETCRDASGAWDSAWMTLGKALEREGGQGGGAGSEVPESLLSKILV
jgi:hypothetical protein